MLLKNEINDTFGQRETEFSKSSTTDVVRGRQTTPENVREAEKREAARICRVTNFALANNK